MIKTLKEQKRNNVVASFHDKVFGYCHLFLRFAFPSLVPNIGLSLMYDSTTTLKKVRWPQQEESATQKETEKKFVFPIKITQCGRKWVPCVFPSPPFVVIAKHCAVFSSLSSSIPSVRTQLSIAFAGGICFCYECRARSIVWISKQTL